MTDQNKYHNYTLADIEQYLQGKLSPAEMHELEKAALQDPFLADAIEGYKDTQLSTAHEHLAKIHRQLSLVDAAKYTGIVKTIASKSWLKIAAAVILVAGAGTVGWFLLNTTGNKKELAIQTAPVIDSVQKKNNAEPQALALTQKPANNKPALANDRQKTNAAPKNIDKTALAAREMAAPPAAKDRMPERPVLTSTPRDISLDNPQSPAQKMPRQEPETDSAKMQGSATLASVINTSAFGKESKNPTGLKLQAQAVSGSVAGVQIVGAGNRSLQKDSSSLKFHTNPFRVSSDTLYFYSGKLITPDKMPVAGASLVFRNNRQKAFVSRPDGSFSLGVLDSALEMTVNSVGFESAKVKLVPGENNTITLRPANEMLDEVVVTNPGYERTKKSNAAPVKEQATGISPDGGWEAFRKYLINKLALSAKDQKDGVYGRVEIQLNINATGEVSKVGILSSFNNGLHDAIIKAIKEGPSWISPGKKKIRNARVTINL